VCVAFVRLCLHACLHACTDGDIARACECKQSECLCVGVDAGIGCNMQANVWAHAYVADACVQAPTRQSTAKSQLASLLLCLCRACVARGEGALSSADGFIERVGMACRQGSA